MIQVQYGLVLGRRLRMNNILRIRLRLLRQEISRLRALSSRRWASLICHGIDCGCEFVRCGLCAHETGCGRLVWELHMQVGTAG